MTAPRHAGRSAGGRHTKRSLSPACARLVTLFQEINFGRIERLGVRNGLPIFEPPPRVIRKIKVGAENRPRPETSSQDFLLKKEIIEFFNHLSDVGDGVIKRIEVRHGLPRAMEIEETTGP